MSRLSTIRIVGASLAGLRAADALRRHGFEGRLVVHGAEAHMPYDRPPLSKELLAGDWEPDRCALAHDQGLGIEWRPGCAAVGLALAERTLRLEDGREEAWDGLVIATGATPRELPGQPDLPGLFTLRTLDDALRLRAALDAGPRVAVVGAGFIGAEVAATCRGRGLDVTMIEALPVPLERALGGVLGKLVADLHRDHGVDLRLGVGVRRVLGDRRVEGLELSDGDRVAADVVVVGIGVRPETRWLEGSGIALDDGVLCDAACRASAPGVVAAGDVARWPNPRFDEVMRLEHWTNAGEQADAAARALLAGEGGAEPFAPVPFFWSDQYDRKIQFAGRASSDDAMRVVDGSMEERRFVALFERGGRLRGVLGMNRPRLVMKARRLLREDAPFDQALAAFG
jgi:3-phenylpropionate/trans-cinnamate dioxygenase ferredoxin reductase subunit